MTGCPLATKNIHNINFPRKLSGMPSASAGAWTRVSDERDGCD